MRAACDGIQCGTGDPSSVSYNGSPLPGPPGTGLFCGALGIVDLNCVWNPNTTFLSVRHNSITAVPANMFNGLPNLLTVMLGYNSITFIAPNAFSNLTLLQNLFAICYYLHISMSNILLQLDCQCSANHVASRCI